jgi:hypothetical protein
MKTNRPISISLIILSVCLLASIGAGCRNPDEKGASKTMTKRDINAVKDAHVDELMAMPGVAGVYVGELEDHTPAIGVMVVKMTPELEQKIPKTLEGYPVKIDETGVIRPMK